MSKHWRPDDDVARARFGGGERLRSAGDVVPPEFAGPAQRAKRQRLPEGGAAGLLLVAAASIGVGIALYQVLGPREVVAAGAEKHLVEVERR